MQQLSDEERAMRGVIARLAGLFFGKYTDKIPGNHNTISLGEKKLIKEVSKFHLELKAVPFVFSFGAPTNPDIMHADPAITTSEIRAMPLEKRGTTIDNPYYSSEEIIRKILPEMEKKGFIKRKMIKNPQGIGYSQLAHYSLGEQGVYYLSSYDRPLAEEVAKRLEIRLPSESEIRETFHIEDAADTPWASLMPMAKRYAETICRKPEWDR